MLSDDAGVVFASISPQSLFVRVRLSDTGCYCSLEVNLVIEIDTVDDLNKEICLSRHACSTPHYWYLVESYFMLVWNPLECCSARPRSVV